MAPIILFQRSPLLAVGIQLVLLTILTGTAFGMLGAQDLGIWAFINATTSTLALAGSAVITALKSRSRASNGADQLNELGFWSNALKPFHLMLIYLISYPLLSTTFTSMLGPMDLATGSAVLIACMLNNCLQASARQIFPAGAEIQQQPGVEMASSGVYVLVALCLMPSQGLLALALGQLAGTLFVWFRAVLHFRSRPDSGPAPEASSSATTAVQKSDTRTTDLMIESHALIEPISGICIGLIGGFSAAGLYELASRPAFCLRNLIAAHCSWLIFHDLRSRLTRETHRPRTYRKLRNLVHGFGALSMSQLFVLTPALSCLWLDELDLNFVLTGWLLTLGCWASLHGLPCQLLLTRRDNRSAVASNGLAFAIPVTAFAVLGQYLGNSAGAAAASLSTFALSTLVFVRKAHQQTSLDLRGVSLKRSSGLVKPLLLTTVLTVLFAWPDSTMRANQAIMVSTIMLIVNLAIALTDRQIHVSLARVMRVNAQTVAVAKPGDVRTSDRGVRSRFRRPI